MSENITYSEWLNLVNGVKQRGMDKDSYVKLKSSYPHNLDKSLKTAFFNQIIELEKVLLEAIFKRLKNDIVVAINEADEELAFRAVYRYSKDIDKCLFFEYLEIIPKDNCSKLYDEIVKNVRSFQSSVERYLFEMSIDNSIDFIEDIIYVIRRKNPVKKMHKR